jgi:flagellin-like protein
MEDQTMKNIWKKEEGVSPVIAVILMVAITVVLAAVLYVMVSGMMTSTSTTPTGAMDFTEGSQTGNFSGSFVSLSKSVKLSDTQVTIIDDSTGGSASINNLEDTKIATVPGGLTLTYNDINGNNKVDGGDTIRCNNADSKDQIKFVYEPTGGVIAQYTFP